LNAAGRVDLCIFFLLRRFGDLDAHEYYSTGIAEETNRTTKSLDITPFILRNTLLLVSKDEVGLP